MRILIVDDTPAAAETLASAARLAGAEVVDMVASGEDAIGKAILEEYDLITLDIRMPGVSGLDAMSVIRGLRPHAILAIISAFTTDLDPEALRSADVVFSKPLPIRNFQEVVKLTQEMVDRRKKIQALGES